MAARGSDSRGWSAALAPAPRILTLLVAGATHLCAALLSPPCARCASRSLPCASGHARHGVRRLGVGVDKRPASPSMVARTPRGAAPLGSHHGKFRERREGQLPHERPPQGPEASPGRPPDAASSDPGAMASHHESEDSAHGPARGRTRGVAGRGLTGDPAGAAHSGGVCDCRRAPERGGAVPSAGVQGDPGPWREPPSPTVRLTGFRLHELAGRYVAAIFQRGVAKTIPTRVGRRYRCCRVVEVRHPGDSSRHGNGASPTKSHRGRRPC